MCQSTQLLLDHLLELLGQGDMKLMYKSNILKYFSFVALSILFSTYYYLYFFSFDQGISSASGSIRLSIFFLGVLLFVLTFFKFQNRVIISPVAFALLLFIILSMIIFLLKVMFFDGLSGNNILFSAFGILFVLFEYRLANHEERTQQFMEMSLWILMIQIIIDICLRYNGIKLWDDGSYVGGLGNPSSFALFNIVNVAYLLFLRKITIITMIGIPLIFFAILKTESLFGIIALIIVVVYYFYQIINVRHVYTKLSFVCFILITVFSLLSVYFALDVFFSNSHLFYKIDSLLNALFGGHKILSNSASISIRSDNYSNAWNYLNANVFDMLLYGNRFIYTSVDSQLLTYLYSYGILTSFLFLTTILMMLSDKMYGFSSQYKNFIKIILVIFCLMFLSNRIIDYYPILVVYLVLISSMLRGNN